ncbi:hypothetical protein WA577_004632, partial [Blastocystis sp. JDR]
MKPCLDVLFDAYAYEKEQYGIVDTITIEEYEHLLKQFKVSRSMGLKLHGSPNCAACGKSLIQKMENGQKENVVLFGCGHAVHQSCLAEDRCPVPDCWKDIQTSDKKIRRQSFVGQIQHSSQTHENQAKGEERSIEDLVSNLNTGEFGESNFTLECAAPTPSAIFRRKWLLKAMSMSSCLEMDID